MRLVEGLKLLKQRATLGSLASSDDLEFAELCQFRQILVLKSKILLLVSNLSLVR